MHYITHFFAGILISTLFMLILPPAQAILTYGICCSFSILPDIDVFIGNDIKNCNTRANGLQHRCGLTHSIYSFTFPLIFILINPLIISMISLALFSHWLLDAATLAGVRTIATRNWKSFFQKRKNDFRILDLNSWAFLPNFVLFVPIVLILSIWTDFILFTLLHWKISLIIYPTLFISTIISWQLTKDYKPKFSAIIS